MSRLDIVRKLRVELDNGIATEAQVVYVLAGIRKFLELQPTNRHYLKFHCDWALHSQLDRGMSQKILSLFDTVHVQRLRIEP